MSKRYYTCQIIGNGTETDPYRPAIAREIESKRETSPNFDAVYSVVIKTHPPGHPQAGHPVTDKALVVVSSNDHTPFLGKADIDPLPDVALDSKVSSIHTPTKNGMLTRLRARGFETRDFDGFDGFREIVRGIGRQIDSGFDENSFDVLL